MNMPLLDVAHALGGRIYHGQVIAPDPFGPDGNRDMTVRLDPFAPRGFIVLTRRPGADIWQLQKHILDTLEEYRRRHADAGR